MLDLSPVNIIELIKKIVIKKPINTNTFGLRLYFSKKNPEQIKQNPNTKCPIFNSFHRKLATLSGSTDANPNILCLNIYSKSYYSETKKKFFFFKNRHFEYI